MTYLRCDNCGLSINHRGCWGTPIKTLCEKCSKSHQTNYVIRYARSKKMYNQDINNINTTTNE